MSDDTPDQNRTPLLIGLGIAAGVGFLTHWSLGVLVGLVIIYKFADKPVVTQAVAKQLVAQYGQALKRNDCYSEKKEVMAVPVDISGHGNFDLEVVGEDHYRSEIAEIIPDQYLNQGRFRIYFIATLNEEDDNPHDKNAVAVRVKKLVGYLSRTDAKKYRKWKAKSDAPANATCRCVVVGRQEVDSFGIWIDHPELASTR